MPTWILGHEVGHRWLARLVIRSRFGSFYREATDGRGFAESALP